MANVGSGSPGYTLIGTGNGASPSYVQIGTNSNLTAHGVLLGQGNSPFTASAVGTNGQVLIGANSANPAFATLTSSDSSILFSPGANSLDIRAASTGFNPSTTATYYDDCFNQIQWDLRGSGTNSGAGYFAPEAGHPGMFAVTTGTDTGGKASAIYSTLMNNNGNFLLGTQTFTYTTLIKVVTLPTAMDDYAFIVGVNDYWIFSSANGVSFKIDGSAHPNWALESANGGAFTTTYSSVPITTGWHKLSMIGNSTSVALSVDGVSIGTLSTNMPTNPININSMSVFKSAGTTAIFLYQDYFQFSTTVSR